MTDQKLTLSCLSMKEKSNTRNSLQASSSSYKRSAQRDWYNFARRSHNREADLCTGQQICTFILVLHHSKVKHLSLVQFGGSINRGKAEGEVDRRMGGLNLHEGEDHTTSYMDIRFINTL